MALQSAQLPKACHYSQSCPKRAGRSPRCLLSSLGLFPVCSPPSEPWLGRCCGGDAERMMKPYKNVFILLLERVGKARGERRREARGDARLAHLMPTWLFCYVSHLSSCFSDCTRCQPGSNPFRLRDTPTGSFPDYPRGLVLACLASSSSSLTRLAKSLVPCLLGAPMLKARALWSNPAGF